MNKMFALLGILSLLFFGLSVWKNSNREWKKYQNELKKIEYNMAMTEEAKERIKNRNLEIKQIFIEELGVVDRCTTCHLRVDNAGSEINMEPFKAHPDIFSHPPEIFGCTTCHRGQGRATTVQAAHGDVKHWYRPLLRGDYIQASCGKCHIKNIPDDAPLLAYGIELYDQYSCADCHKINGEGESLGPDLSNEGNKRSIEWHFKHFKNPQVFSPESEMPDFELSDEEIKALTIYMLSLTKEKIPANYTK